MIDPLETVVNYLKRDGQLMELVGGSNKPRIATKYQPEWDGICVVVRPDGGSADVDVPHQPLGLDIRCYAGSQFEAMRAWRRLVEIARATVRTIVSTSEGDAVLYYFLQSGAPALLWDTDLSLDFCFGLFSADVSENSPV